ncbi:MAG: hypothetical protein K2H40_00970 [Lachnospiraceae bacterium]|nr:hypothetical protein [Lachnospiraceae bacterium]
MDLVFVTLPKNAMNSRDGWKIVKALTDHPALSSFDAATIDDIMRNV